MYWNPNGVAISADPNIRQICQEQDIMPSSEGSKIGFTLFSHKGFKCMVDIKFH